jgi:cytochrome b
MTAVNLALRFLLELASIAALAVWGYRTGGGGTVGIGLAIVACSVLVITWGLFFAPRSRTSPLPHRWRTLLGSVTMLVAAALLAVAGEPMLGAALAALVTVNTALLMALGATDTEPGRGRRPG